MKVVTAPLTFKTGDVLDAPGLNELWAYAADAVADVATKRWVKAPLTFPFAGLTEASGELLSFRFTCPVQCVIERAFIGGGVESGGFLGASLVSSAPVHVDITAVSGGATPSGATVPWLRTGTIASASEAVVDLNVNRVTLDAGVEYEITVSSPSSGTFTLTSFDVTLHLAIDRWTLTSQPDVPDLASLTFFTDASARNANTVNAYNSEIATQAAKFAASKAAPTPILALWYGFNDATSVNLRRFALPRWASSRAQAVMKRLYVYAVMAGTGGDKITADVFNGAGAGIGVEAIALVAGLNVASGDSGAVSVSLVGSVTPDDPTDDYRFEILANDPEVCSRAHALLWVARA